MSARKISSCAMLLAVAAAVNCGAVHAAAVGDSAPEIKAEGWINTESLSLAALRDKIVVLEFWATW